MALNHDLLQFLYRLPKTAGTGINSERELPIYFVGCVIALCLSVAAAARWRVRANQQAENDPSFGIRGCTISLVLVAVGSIVSI